MKNKDTEMLIEAYNSIIKEGVGRFQLRKTDKYISSEANSEDCTPEVKTTTYDIYENNVKVGEISIDDYFGTTSGKMYGRNLPEISSYQGGNIQSSFHRFLKSNTGRKWLAVPSKQKNSR